MDDKHRWLTVLPLLACLFFSAAVLLKSLNEGEAWRIAFAASGFCLLAFLSFLFLSATKGDL
jgi:hypothetical protein